VPRLTAANLGGIPLADLRPRIQGRCGIIRDYVLLRGLGATRYAPAVSIPNFEAAAYRHHGDARFLLHHQRWPNADHLAGAAAECALKAILLGGNFGVALSRQRPFWGTTALGHLNGRDDLWGQFTQIVAGRSAQYFAALIAGPRPLASWDIADRYSDGSAIRQEDARDNVDKAKEIIGILEQAKRDGVVS
jgi:hypothetical protein